MKRNRFWRMVTLGIKQFRDPYYQGFAAQLSFYFMLSIVPIIILLSQVLANIFQSSLEDAVGWLLQYSKGTVSDELNKILTYKTAGFSNFIYIFVAIWASSRAQFSMMRITNFMFTEGKSTGKGYWRERFRAVVNMLLFMIIIVLALVALVFGGKIIELLGWSAAIWTALRWPVALLLYFLLISYSYYIMPTDKIKFRQVLPGSIFASVGLVLVTMIYSFYTTRIADYNIIYGVLGNIVAIMFWFFFLAWVLCLGILLNKVWMDTTGGKDEMFLD
ncbi:MAG: YihY/virulence factor BrkB family protein [Eubacteriaceae bacterium]|nr:YihY/virulence factor BrkB family protein [Eubacteriaceae bacterium]